MVVTFSIEPSASAECRLPGIDIEVFLREVGGHNSAARELPSSKRLDSLLRSVEIGVFDEDFSDAWVDASAARARNLDVEDLPVFGAFLFNVFFDLCNPSY
jgi:hypothetical protein